MTWWLVATQVWVGRWDAVVLHEAAAERLPWLTPIALRFTDLAGTTILPVLVGAAVTVLAAVRRIRAAAALTVALVGSAVVVFGMKLLVARPRPPVSLMAGPVEQSFSFPSGHTTTATAVLIVGAALIARAAHRPAVRIAAWSAAVAGVAGVAASRVYLGYHWLTDVIAATLLGAAVAAMTLLLLPRRPADEYRQWARCRTTEPDYRRTRPAP
ncbi:phosphatase PAP2 family protein [Blastococcus aggregatus]|uniref:phosphatase PAP2 family protein n=1 Tax=Blastococcus aggregatus TaxID=38502 RepID=UPI001596EC82|nr:phosphatase PAP2 family protein [Blastococcus aggregatus]